MTAFLFSRSEMAVSLAFHVIFVAIGIGMPVHPTVKTWMVEHPQFHFHFTRSRGLVAESRRALQPDPRGWRRSRRRPCPRYPPSCISQKPPVSCTEPGRCPSLRQNGGGYMPDFGTSAATATRGSEPVFSSQCVTSVPTGQLSPA